MTVVPDAGSSARSRKIAEGFFTSRMPLSVMAKTPSSLTAPNRFLLLRRVRKRESCSPSSKMEQSIMCSRTFGPARLPSLVTWPTKIRTTPDCLAYRVSCAAQSRTCDTLPGAEVMPSECITCMESTTITRGRNSSAAARMASTSVSAISCRASTARSRRSARMATCCGLSSPVTYNAAPPAAR